jgi:DNA-binding NarL/FixJ family response regulator
MVSGNSINIILAKDDGIMREGLKALIRQHANMEVVGEAETEKKLLQLVADFVPDVVLIDADTLKMNGVEVARKIKSKSPVVKVLIISSESSKYMIRQVVSTEVWGFLYKGSTFEDLADAISTVCKNKRYLCKETRSVLADDYIGWLRTGSLDETPSLNKSDYDIVKFLSEGFSVGEIARKLYKSPKTIDARRRKVMDKLDMRNTVELIKFAIRQGITTA